LPGGEVGISSPYWDITKNGKGMSTVKTVFTLDFEDFSGD